MPDVIVQRGSGLSQGLDVVDALLTTDIACLARGRMELDDGSGTHPVQMECVYRDGLMLGDIVESFDPLNQRVQYGILVSITHNITGVEVVTTLRVRVPSEFAI